MNVKLICFGIAKDIIGAQSVHLELPAPFSVEHLKKTIVKKYPKFQNITSFQIAVNESYAENSVVIQAGDEVVIIPPVSGG